MPSGSLRMHQLKRLISTALRTSTVGAIGLLAFGPTLSAADEPEMPRSLDEAIAMERADALPRTAFYDAASLASSKPGICCARNPASDSRCRAEPPRCAFFIIR